MSGKHGYLVFVGSGIQLGRHMSQRALSEVECADVVFVLADGMAEQWLRNVRPDIVSLQDCYVEGQDRRQSYVTMRERILDPVRRGRRVCVVLYGHPGVFADVSHHTLRAARDEGFEGHMEPGVSAEACLYADLGIDPGHVGVQSFEATQFLIYDRVVDPAAVLILWQVALCGDLTCRRFETTPARLRCLVDKLTRWYSDQHEIILYEAALLPVQEPRADRMPLRDLPSAALKEYTTLVLPPARALRHDAAMLKVLERVAGDS